MIHEQLANSTVSLPPQAHRKSCNVNRQTLRALQTEPCGEMERTASAGPFCESEESGTISIDALDDALLSGVLFLAGKPSWCVRAAAAVTAGVAQWLAPSNGGCSS